MLEPPAPPPSVDGEGWPAPRADPRNTGSPDVVGPGNRPGLAWRRRLPGDGLVRAPPVVAGEDLFALDDWEGTLHCLAVGDGSTRWSTSVGPLGESVAPTVTPGAVYLPAGGTLRRLTRAGERVWTAEFPGAVRGVTVSESSLFVATADGTPGVYALDPASGTRRWAVETGLAVSPPAVHDGTVVVGDMHGEVRALDAADGTNRWRYTVADAWVQAPPVVGRHTVFVGSGTADLARGHLYALDLVDGTLRWSLALEGAVLSPVALAGQGLFVADARGTLRRVDAEGGETTWTFSPLGPFDDGVSNVTLDFAPAVSNGLVTYAGPDRRLHVVETDAGDDGRGDGVDARFVGRVEATGPPTLAGDGLFVGTGEGVVAVGRRPPG